MACEGIPSVSYAEFSQRMFTNAGIKRLPVHVQLELTRKCNVSCVHCFVPRHDVDAELTTEEVQRLLAECAAAGTFWFLFTGGEPLTRRDFVENYLFAKRQGLLPGLFTNGTLVTEDIADLFAEWPPWVVEVTVHSMNEAVFDAVTQAPGSFKDCMKGIGLLVDRQVPLRLKTVVMRENLGQFEEVKDFADSVGAPYRYDVQIQPRADRGRSPLVQRLSPREAIELELRDPQRMRVWKELAQREPKWRTGQIYTCGAGIRTCHISPEGRIGVCVMAQHATYDWRTGSFAEAWNDFIPRFISRAARKPQKCSTCDLLYLCGCCPGWAYLEDGDEEAAPEYHCELGLLRKRAAEDREGLERELAVPFGAGGR